MLDVHVVPHTHWDREWYHPRERFRQRLVALVDELLDHPEATFLLDGQAIVLEDYLEVRPDSRDAVVRALSTRSLEAGPWFVLADELIPSGESLVRNLLGGRRSLARLGATPPPVLYCPDSFGHPAALPDLAAGFGFGLVVLWRGYGGSRWPAGDTVRWRGRGGAEVVLHHLAPSGYELGASLPSDAAAAGERWEELRAILAPRAVTGVALLPNGADHHARQRDLDGALLALAERATGDRVHQSSLAGFASALLERTRSMELPVIQGELRDSYGYTWALQGTFATRAHQKRRNAMVERLLVRSAEPWTALAARAGSRSRRADVHAAWRSLLECHPHDTLCGCSIDAVADAMDVRLDAARAQADGLCSDAMAVILGHDPDTARRRRDAWRAHLVVANDSARSRGGVVIAEVLETIADEPVGPGSAATGAAAPRPRRSTPTIEGARVLQVLDRRTRRDRVEAPRHYPDNDLVFATRVALFVDPVPGYGVASLPLGGRRMQGPTPVEPVRTTPSTLENGIWRVEVTRTGVVSVTHRQTGRSVADLLVIEDLEDGGDLYTPSLREPVGLPRVVTARVTRTGPLVGELRTRWTIVPAARVDAVARRGSLATVEIIFELHADSPLLRIRVDGVNAARDHRLRIGFRSAISGGEVWADAAFGPVRRDPLDVPPEDSVAERPPTTAPLHRYVSVFGTDAGATLVSDGLAEYEVTADGTTCVTLVRAVGELSKADLPERPGHAGWPESTPAAQCIGPFAASLALLWHGGRDATSVDAIERAADEHLHPLRGETWRALLETPPPRDGLELEGPGLAFSTFKERDDGEGVVLRCINLLDQPSSGAWRLGFPVREAWLARLDETPLDPPQPLRIADGRILFVAPPRAIVTILAG